MTVLLYSARRELSPCFGLFYVHHYWGSYVNYVAHRWLYSFMVEQWTNVFLRAPSSDRVNPNVHDDTLSRSLAASIDHSYRDTIGRSARVVRDHAILVPDHRAIRSSTEGRNGRGCVAIVSAVGGDVLCRLHDGCVRVDRNVHSPTRLEYSTRRLRDAWLCHSEFRQEAISLLFGSRSTVAASRWRMTITEEVREADLFLVRGSKRLLTDWRGANV